MPSAAPLRMGHIRIISMKKLIFTIDRIEEDKAVLKTEETTIVFPLDKLPNDVQEGDVLYITISKNKEETIASKVEAKDVLNEILTHD